MLKKYTKVHNNAHPRANPLGFLMGSGKHGTEVISGVKSGTFEHFWALPFEIGSYAPCSGTDLQGSEGIPVILKYPCQNWLPW